MSLAQMLSAYLNLNLLILVGVLSLGVFAKVLHFLKFKGASRNELKLHYATFTAMIIFAIIHPVLPSNNIFSPAAKVWSAPSLKSFSQPDVSTESSGYLSLTSEAHSSSMPVSEVVHLWLVGFFILFVAGCFQMGRDLIRLYQIKKDSFLFKKCGRVHIYINDTLSVPFSYWWPGQANIVIPSALLMSPQDFHMSIAHEAQHHRQADTRWVYVLWSIKLICFFNPAIHCWSRWISEIQEFACDEALVDRKKVDSQAYARCLVEVAQTAFDQKKYSVCATGLTFLIERHLLQRRIEKMLEESSKKTGRAIGIPVGFLIVFFMATTAFATKGLIQDRRVNLTQAKAMADRAQSESGMPIIVNDLVLKQLNRYIGTPEGREFMRASLARMQNYKGIVTEHLQKYGLPFELLAVPIIESGYQNLTQGQSSQWLKTAGLWQFIPGTAKNYGMQVDDKKDERLDVALNTDAAMRLLQANHLRFKDWHLSLLAYNMGENGVQKGIDALATRDAWTLIRHGHEGDKDYLPRVMAAMLILKNPETVQ